MVRLRRSSPDRPGWTRRRAGKGFVYLDEDGSRLAAEDAQRVKDLVIPPAWQDVWICPWPNGHLQAVGTDDAGRRQYLYHPDWRTRRDGEKFQKMVTFGKALSKAREQVLVDLGAEGMTQERACAVAVRLLDLGYFRIGNDVYAEENNSFGLTTLERRHVRREGKTLVFDFVGKSGIEHLITIDDPGAVEALEVMRKRRGGDDRLLAWKDGRRWRPVDSVARQRVRRPDDGHGGHGQGLPHLARDRDRGGRRWPTAGEPATKTARKRAVVGGDEGGLGVPRQHPHAGAVVVRRPARRGRVRGGQDHRGGDAADVQDRGRASRRRSSAPCCGC